MRRHDVPERRREKVRRLALGACALCSLGAAAIPAARTIVVGPGETHTSVQAALDAAAPGDTVVVSAGTYAERPVIRTALVLRGLSGAVLDGGGEGTVLTVSASAHVSGFTIRGSGRDLSREDSGVMVVEADDVVIEDLALEDVLFGIYLKQSRRAVVRGNRVTGKPLPVGERGDGIRLWYCDGGEVTSNTLERVRDLVIWFSSNLEVTRNVVRDSRYGVHYMYSDHNRFEDNEFRNNHVGAFIMYSSDISFRRNLFLEAYGPTGVGLGLKDADDIRAAENAFVGNGVGISLDNSPASVGVVNDFRGNLLALNDLAVSLLPSVHSNAFRDNAFIANTTPVAVTGGGDALANTWEGNRWSEYAGFDEDADGVGDTPFRYDRVADALFARRPELRWLTLSPAAGTLDLLGRLFPLLEPEPIVIDPAPRIRAEEPPGARAPDTRAWGAEAFRSADAGPGATIVVALALAGFGVGCAAMVLHAGRRRRWAA